MRNLSCILILLLFAYAKAFSQIQLNLEKFITQEPNLHVYSVSITNKSNSKINVAGHNLRIFYDAKTSKFVPEKLVSFLPESYVTLKVVQNIVGNAKGFGTLAFEQNLGFINLATDYKLESDKIISLNVNESFIIAQLYFEGEPNEFVFGQDGITNGYATAFNEFAQLKDKKLQKLEISRYMTPMSKMIYALGQKTTDINIVKNTQVVSLNTQTEKSINFTGDASKGKYVLLGSHVDNLDNLLKDVEVSSIDGEKYIVSYQKTLDDAKAQFRYFTNIGIRDITIFLINQSGQLENVKIQ